MWIWLIHPDAGKDEPDHGVSGEYDRQPDGRPYQNIFTLSHPFLIAGRRHPNEAAVDKHGQRQRADNAQNSINNSTNQLRRRIRSRTEGVGELNYTAAT